TVYRSTLLFAGAAGVFTATFFAVLVAVFPLVFDSGWVTLERPDFCSGWRGFPPSGFCCAKTRLEGLLHAHHINDSTSGRIPDERYVPISGRQLFAQISF